MSSARKICRRMLAYRFKSNTGQPDKVRLELAKKAAKSIQGLVREHHSRKRHAHAAKIQSLWRRYTARCMFVHQLRLRRAAVGFQLVWRGYFVRTRFRVREKIQELKLAKKAIGKQWFKAAAAARDADKDPDRIAAEKRRREEIRVGVEQCASFVRGERRRLGAVAMLKNQAILEDEQVVDFGAMPPAPTRKIVPGSFDIQPKAKRLRDGREVPFDGEADFVRPPPAQAKGSSSSLSATTKTSSREVERVTAFKCDTAVKDPPDFDVVRKGPGELWGEDEDGAAAAKAAADRASEAMRAAGSRSNNERILCFHCKKGFASVSCAECRSGYCHRCSTHVHSQPGRLGHDLVPFQRPEKIINALERGLDGGGKRGDAKKAKRAARSLPDCARRAESFLKSMALLKHKEMIRADENRVKMKAKDRKEMEEAQERARRAQEEYDRASTEEKNAATTVQHACKGLMRKLLLKRESELCQRAQEEDSKLKLKETVTRVQALYRGFSVRNFLKESAASVGETNAGLAVVLPEGVRPILPGVSRDKTAAAARARRDCAFRRRWEREAAISKMIHLEEESTRTFASDVRWAVENHTMLQAKSNLLKTRRGAARSAWTRQQARTGRHAPPIEEKSALDPALPPDDPERTRFAKEIELQDIRILHQTSMFEIVEKGLYWTRAFIRQHYRRHAAHLARKAGSRHTFAWLEEELYVLDEVVAFATKKLDGAADVLEQEFFRGWLSDQISRAGKQRLMIDLEQENLLESETARLLKEKEHASKCRENLQELLKAYHIDAQLGAERVGAELANTASEEATDEKFLWTTRVTGLKNKEQSVRGKVQASLQRGLEEEIASEDRYLTEEVTITGDVADAPIAHFAKIKASLVEPPRHPAHMSFESWRKVYRAQPWLAAQTQAENKRKAARASTIEGLEEMRAVVAAAKSQEAFAAKEVASLKAEIEAFQKRLAFKRSGAPEDAAQEPLSDDERIRMEIDVAKTKEKLEDQEERLERRRKANSHKDEELKKKEADLEAEITAEEERHSRQAAAISAFRAAERDDTAAQFGKDHADAAVERMKHRIEKLKAIQVLLQAKDGLSDKTPEKQKGKKKGFMGTMVEFALGTDREGDDDNEAQELDYAEQTQLIAKKAKLALVNRQIEELKRAKKTISSDYASADAQLMLAE
ncbi:unnamed protein product, partial [Ectocarpus sp. 12 AP-2014]